MGKGMHLRGLLGTIARVEYSIPVPEFYLVLHDLLNIKNEKLTLNLSINITKLSLMCQLTNKACSLVKYGMFVYHDRSLTLKLIRHTFVYLVVFLSC